MPNPLELQDVPAENIRTTIAVTLHVNGEARELAVAPWTTLLDALRDHLGLTPPVIDRPRVMALTCRPAGRRPAIGREVTS